MIRWINERLGTAPWGAVSTTDNVRVLDVRDLVDRRGNYASDVRRKIDEAVSELASGRRVVVCCDYGISRSNAVAAGVIALSEATSLDDAVSLVLDRTGELSVKLEMLSAVRESLGNSQSQLSRASAILLTGGTGFIGRRLALRLESTFQLVAPTREEADLGHGCLALDRIVRERGVGTVVHLAHPHVVTANASLGEAVTAMKNLVDVCSANSLRLVFLSGWEVFSGYQSHEPVVADEVLPPLPSSTYGFSKAFCEALAHQVAAQQNFPFSLIRSGPVFGAESDRPRFIRTFVDQALRHEPIVVHRYRNDLPRLDLMHVDDLVDGLAAVINDAREGTFHFGTGHLTSTTDIAKRVISVLESRSLIVTREIDASVCNVAMDTSKAREQFGWGPKIDPGSALDELIRDISHQGWVSPVKPMLRTDK